MKNKSITHVINKNNMTEIGFFRNDRFFGKIYVPTQSSKNRLILTLTSEILKGNFKRYTNTTWPNIFEYIRIK